MGFQRSLDALIGLLDDELHTREIQALRRCRSVNDLEQVTREGGWLTPSGAAKRVKLLKHNTNTYMLLSYEQGWSTRIGHSTF
jgi:hypothetical protein